MPRSATMIAPVELADGSWFDLGAPHVADVPPTWVLGQHLSRINRFVGGSSRPVDVAEHSLRVGAILGAQGHDAATILGGLLHDAAEAFTSDIPSGLKRLIAPAWDPVERSIQSVVAERYGLTIDDLDSNAVRRADRLACAAEAYAEMPSRGRDWGLPPLKEYPAHSEINAAVERLGLNADVHEARFRDLLFRRRRVDAFHASAWGTAVVAAAAAVEGNR